MKKQMNKVNQILERLNDYMAEVGCEHCPFEKTCKGYDKGGCYFENALQNLTSIANLPQEVLDSLVNDSKVHFQEYYQE